MIAKYFVDVEIFSTITCQNYLYEAVIWGDCFGSQSSAPVAVNHKLELSPDQALFYSESLWFVSKFRLQRR